MDETLGIINEALFLGNFNIDESLRTEKAKLDELVGVIYFQTERWHWNPVDIYYVSKIRFLARNAITRLHSIQQITLRTLSSVRTEYQQDAIYMCIFYQELISILNNII